MLSALSGLVLTILILQFLVKRVNVLRKAYQHPSNIPRKLCLIEPLSKVGATLPTFWGSPGLYFIWYWKETYYKIAKSETIMFIPLIWGSPVIYTACPEMTHEVLGFQSTFVKSEMAKQGVGAFGANIVASSGEQWRRHRKITAPAFDQPTYELVWEEVTRLYHEMLVGERMTGKDTVNVKSLNAFTTKLALSVICACGFNEPLSWSEDLSTFSQDPSIPQIVREISPLIVPQSVIPSWAYYLPIKGIKRINEIFNLFQTKMDAKIALRKDEAQKNDPSLSASESTTARDIFSRLIYASGETGLSNEEVLSNSFAFLFAGHETTAHSMAITAALWALYPEEQAIAYDAVKSVTSGGRNPSINDYKHLTPILASLYEAIRLYPAGYVALRDATQVTSLPINVTAEGAVHQGAVPKGVMVVIDMIGVNRNPRHYPMPHDFKPSRWQGKLDSFVGFSIGPRACLGRKFATLEAVCFLSLLLRDWELHVVMKPGETDKEWLDRVLKVKLATTLTTGDIPLVLKRRR